MSNPPWLMICTRLTFLRPGPSSFRIGGLLAGVSGPHEERVIEEAPDELHADLETG